jgi:enoyl-CoA hydratase/carnithine racemase
MSRYKDYKTLKLEIRDKVARIRFIPYEKCLTEPGVDTHWDIGEVLGDIRGDNSVRVVVLEGDERNFLVTPTKEWQSSELGFKYVADQRGAWLTFTGIVRAHMTLAEMEKPVVAKVNGDAIGFGASLVFGSDIIIANKDARICHMHMSMGELGDVGPEYGLVPGDGGAALVPLYMSPAKAKEWLMLGPVVPAGDLAAQGMINYAVEATELERKVGEIVEKLLSRSAHALAWTKRVATRRIVDHLNMTLDAAAAYELVTAMQAEKSKLKNNFDLY